MSRKQHLFYPVALGLTGALAVFFSGGLNWVSASLALLLAAAGLALGLRLVTQQSAGVRSIKRYLASQQELGEQVAPV